MDDKVNHDLYCSQQIIMKIFKSVRDVLCVALSLVLANTVAAQDISTSAGQNDRPDNGTDPTRLSRKFITTYEYLDFGGGLSSNVVALRYDQPLGSGGHTALIFRVPLSTTAAAESNDFGLDDFGIGDVSLKLSHVLKSTKTHGIVVSGELIFDTADRKDQGAGVDVFEATFIYARFLPSGAIFAPTLVHDFSIGDPDPGRSEISSTTIDLYYVPRLPQPYYMTLDPSFTVNWETDQRFGGLAVTLGRGFRTGFPGHTSVYLKPEIGIGHERAFDWGVEVGFKVVGF